MRAGLFSLLHIYSSSHSDPFMSEYVLLTIRCGHFLGAYSRLVMVFRPTAGWIGLGNVAAFRGIDTSAVGRFACAESTGLAEDAREELFGWWHAAYY